MTTTQIRARRLAQATVRNCGVGVAVSAVGHTFEMVGIRVERPRPPSNNPWAARDYTVRATSTHDDPAPARLSLYEARVLADGLPSYR